MSPEFKAICTQIALELNNCFVDLPQFYFVFSDDQIKCQQTVGGRQRICLTLLLDYKGGTMTVSRTVKSENLRHDICSLDLNDPAFLGRLCNVIALELKQLRFRS
jgi:hypothetical protein